MLPLNLCTQTIRENQDAARESCTPVTAALARGGGDQLRDRDVPNWCWLLQFAQVLIDVELRHKHLNQGHRTREQNILKRKAALTR